MTRAAQACFHCSEPIPAGVDIRAHVHKMMHEGYIGRVYMSRGLVFRWRGDIGNKGFEPVPDGLNYDIWAGPAAKRPFSRNIVHYNWHWTFEYGNGDVGNQGIHETDLCMW